MHAMKKSRGLIYLAIAAVGIGLGGCTTTTITPSLATVPTQSYERVAIGTVGIVKQYGQWGSLLPHFRHALVARLNKDTAFATVLDPAPANLPRSSILLSGNITLVNKGSKAARWIIGFGAGRAQVAGIFEIRDASGRLMASFESRKAYSGGAGIGGADFLDMEDLIQQLGTETANSVIRWSNGQSLKPPTQ